jgi:DNA-binding transcriptional LysR family regulator
MGATGGLRRDRWPGLELRHLLAFLAVSEESSFNAAGQRLGYTQPAISRQVAALERIVGKKLLDRPRAGRPARFTEAGEVVARFARVMMSELSRAYHDVRALDADPSRLRLGMTPGVGPDLLTCVLDSLGNARREIEIEVVELLSDTALVSLLELNEIEACFAELPLPDGPFDQIEVVREELLLVVQSHSPLASRSTPPSLAEIAGLPLLCGQDSRGAETALATLRTLNPALRVVFHSGVAETIHAMVAAGLGVALLPDSRATDPHGRTVAVHLDEGLPPIRVGLVWNREAAHSRNVEKLIAGLSASRLVEADSLQPTACAGRT